MAANSYLIAGRPSLAGLTPAAFGEALSAAAIASVLIEGASEQAEADMVTLRDLVKAGQEAGAAVLLDAIAPARALHADGVHLGFDPEPERAEAQYRAARAALGSAIIGVDAGQSRHNAMVLGELGADYVAFSGSDRQGLAACVTWWADLFEPPVVAWDVTNAEECYSLMHGAVDFIAIRIDVAADIATRTRELQRWLRGEES